MRLGGKVAIVTGAGQGIGKGIACALSREGTKVVMADIAEIRGETLREVEGCGSEVLAVRVNVASWRDAGEMARAAVERFGRIDILVNNAGIYPYRPLLEMTEEDWDRVMGVNLKGVFNCTKAVLPKMVYQRGGNIINIASIAGAVVGFSNLAHYSASKGGVLGFTRAAALELAPYGIRVNAIAPGSVETPGTMRGADEAALKQFLQMIPLRRMGVPADIGNLAVFLASDESSYITGQLIVADGGYTIQ